MTQQLLEEEDDFRWLNHRDLGPFFRILSWEESDLGSKKDYQLPYREDQWIG